MIMAQVRKNDLVKVIAGKEKGKTGKVLKVFPDRMQALVQGLNFVKKHVRRKREDQQGGIIQKENPIQLSNLMLYCTKCNRPARVGVRTLEDGTKVRVCRKCREVI